MVRIELIHNNLIALLARTRYVLMSFQYLLIWYVNTIKSSLINHCNRQKCTQSNYSRGFTNNEITQRS